MTLGLVWSWAFPINKNLWTSSYVAFTAGVACVTLGTVTWLVDVARWDRWIGPFVAFGANAHQHRAAQQSPKAPNSVFEEAGRRSTIEWRFTS